jgi:hypothetical protein
MGEYVYASVKLGGKVTKVQAEELVQLIAGKGLTLEDMGSGPTVENLGEQFASCQVNYGDLDEITDYCAEHGIAYEHYHAEGGDWDAKTVRRYPDGTDIDFIETQDGPAIPVSELTKTDALASGWAALHEKLRLWEEPFPPPLEIEG